MNPAALAWALVLGHEARASEADEREVMSMSESNYTNYGADGHGYFEHTDKDDCIEQLTSQLESTRQNEAKIADMLAEADARIAALEKANRAQFESWQMMERVAEECRQLAEHRGKQIVELMCELERARRLLRCLEWSGDHTAVTCPYCRALQYHGHRRGCELDAAIAGEASGEGEAA